MLKWIEKNLFFFGLISRKIIDVFLIVKEINKIIGMYNCSNIENDKYSLFFYILYQ